MYESWCLVNHVRVLKKNINLLLRLRNEACFKFGGVLESNKYGNFRASTRHPEKSGISS